MTAPARYVPGLVLNLIATLAGLCLLPALLLPMLKLAFLGLVMNPIMAALGYVIAGVLISLGPLVGIVLSRKGTHRGVTLATGLVSLISLFGFLLGLSALGLSPLEREGHAVGPRPEECKVVTSDSSAIARHCNPDGGPGPEGDCPAGYFCLERVVTNPESTECSIPCMHDCECPDGLSCIYSKCTR